MIVPDINLLLYAIIDSFPEHARAKEWWEALLNGQEEVGLCAPVLFGFLRLGTNPRVFDRPLPVEMALGHVEEWLSLPPVRLLHPGPRHLELAFGLIRGLGTAGNLTTDIQIASLALEYQAEVHSNDGDFGRFSGLRWVNPMR
ncbi:MAG TPA: type II toxin-antitoxin system VapC family toxin [Polyangiaceae bacterium]